MWLRNSLRGVGGWYVPHLQQNSQAVKPATRHETRSILRCNQLPSKDDSTLQERRTVSSKWRTCPKGVKRLGQTKHTSRFTRNYCLLPINESYFAMTHRTINRFSRFSMNYQQARHSAVRRAKNILSRGSLPRFLM